MATSEINDIIKQLDDAVSEFVSDIPRAEMKIYAAILRRIKELETNSLGGIKNNVANLRLLSDIRKDINGIINEKPYLKKVDSFTRAFGAANKLNDAYLSTIINKYDPPSVLNEIKKANIQTTVEQLTQSGIGGNFSNDIKNILLRNVTSGGSYSDMAESLRQTILGDKSGEGGLSKYAKQIATDAINQYNAQYIKTVTDDLGMEWFVYQGSNIESTRPFCRAMTKKRFFHKSEIPELLAGHIGEKDVALSDKTGLPYGMIEDTNENNFQINRGGYNCRHQIYPVTKAAVPQELLDQFANTSA